MRLEFQLVPRGDNPEEKQFQARIKLGDVQYIVIPDRSGLQPEEGKEVWNHIGGFKHTIFEDPIRPFKIVTALLTAPTPRAERRQARKAEVASEKAARLEEERRKAQQIAEERRREIALRPKKADKKGKSKKSKESKEKQKSRKAG